MDRQTHLIHRRNVLIAQFSWGFVGAALLAGVLIRKDPMALWGHPAMIALAIGVPFTYLIGKKIWVVPTMYIFIGLIYLYFFLLLTGSPMLINFMFMWLGLPISSIYQNYFLIVISGCFSLLISGYAFFYKHQAVFGQVPESHFIYIVLFDLFLTLFLLALTRFTRTLWMRSERSRIHLNNILDNVDIATWSFNSGTKQMDISSGLERISGIPVDIIKRGPDAWQEIVPPEDLSVLKQAVRDGYKGLTGTIEFRVLCTDGSYRWLQGRFFPLYEEQQITPASAGVMFDITDRKQMEQRIEYLAYHDTLTGLPNRAYFDKHFALLLSQAQQQDFTAGIMYIDLNGFKEVNDSLGHSAGDELLQMIAGRLKEAVRDTDLLARIGGDEFVIVLKNRSQEEIVAIAERVRDRFQPPFALSGQRIPIGLSLGICFYPQDGSDRETLLNHADQAMYQAKQRGNNQIQIYNP